MVPRAVEITVVYIVDDDNAVREAFSRLLRATGMEPHPYSSAEQFLEEVRDSKRACLLLDITMPRMNGPRVQARLNDRGITIPVITVSAHDDEETRAWTRKLGAKMFLRKPVDDQALLDAINWAVSGNYDR